MKNDQGDRLATSEQMLVDIDTNKRRSASFPTSITSLIEEFLKSEGNVQIPAEAGRRIEIRKRPK